MPRARPRPAPAHSLRRRGAGSRADAAASETLGTYLLAALTILLAAGFAGIVYGNMDVVGSPPHATLALDAAPGSDLVVLTHAGGEALPFRDLRFDATVNGSTVDVLEAALSPPANAWSPGGRVNVTLAEVVPADAVVSVRVYHAERGLVAEPTRAFRGSGGSTSATPVLTDAVVTNANATAPADGATPVRVRVNVTTPAGLLLVDHVTIDLTPLGLTRVDLVDDGTLGDATPLDGTFTRVFVVPPGAPLGNHTLNVTATGADGAHAMTPLELTVVNAAGFGAGGAGSDGADGVHITPKVTSGIAFGGVPSSSNVTKLTVSNISWDHAVPGLLQNDILIMKATDTQNASWTTMILFDSVNGGLGMKELVFYNAHGGCSWTPKDFEITGPLDLLDPRTVDGLGTGSGTSALIPTGIPHGCDEVAPGVLRASYGNARITDPTTLTILRLGESTGADEKTALINTDVDYR